MSESTSADRSGVSESTSADRGGVSESSSAERAGAVFGALSDPTRRLLLSAIAEQTAATATQLASELPISRQAVLKHLNALADAGLLDRTRSGREVRYHFTPAPLSDAVEWMAQVGAEWDDRLAVLGRQFASEAPPWPAGPTSGSVARPPRRRDPR